MGSNTSLHPNRTNNETLLIQLEGRSAPLPLGIKMTWKTFQSFGASAAGYSASVFKAVSSIPFPKKELASTTVIEKYCEVREGNERFRVELTYVQLSFIMALISAKTDWDEWAGFMYLYDMLYDLMEDADLHHNTYENRDELEHELFIKHYEDPL
jgi:hypothetical protein